MLHDIMKDLFLVQRWEGHVSIVDIIDVVVKLRNEISNVLHAFGGIVGYNEHDHRQCA